MRTSTAIVVAVLGALSPWPGYAANAPAKTLISLQIEEQPLDRALSAWARQTGYSVLVPAQPDTASRSARLAAGTYTAEDALRILLENSDLKYEFVTPTTVAVRLEEPGARSNKESMRLAAVPNDGSRDAHADDSGVDPSAVQGRTSRETAGTKRNDANRGLPEVLVTGSSSLDADIRRSPDEVQPYVVIDRKIIEKSGAANLETLLRQQLTMVTGSVPSSQVAGAGNGSQINLRGLGTDETLILIDGRRATGYGSSISPGQPDINGIPLSAVDRIEVLPITASAKFGGGATGGVVNIVLRRDYAGLETKLTYGNTFTADSATRRVDFASGFNLGKTNVLLSAAWSRADDLFAGERDYWRRAQALILSNNPTVILGASNPPLGATTNIRSVSGQPLTLKSNGSSIGSSITSVPYGYAGPSSDGGNAFLTNAGRYNLDLPATAQPGSAIAGMGSRFGLYDAPTIKSFIGTARRSYASWIDTFLEASLSENSANFSRSPSVPAFTISRTAPGNPFNQDIRVFTPLTGVEQQTNWDTKVRRLAGGVIFELPHSWSLGVDYTWNEAKNSYNSGSSAANAAVAAAAASGSLHIFQDTNASPLDFSPFILSPSVGLPSTNTLKDATARLSGHMPISFRGGQPAVSMILEHRNEITGDKVISTETGTFGTFARFLAPSASQDVDSIYAESLLPFVSSTEQIPGLALFELQLSARYDRYRTHGVNLVDIDANFNPTRPVVRTTNEVSSLDPLVGFRYSPAQDIMFRASYGTGFLPPTVAQLVPQPAQLTPLANLRDPLRNNEPLGSVLLTTGGSSTLSSEESQSRSIGVVITPRVLTDLRVSVDWSEIRKRNNISAPSISQQSLEDLINFAPTRISRGAGVGTVPGPITAIDATLINLARLKVRAYDVALDYRDSLSTLGALSLHVGGTRLVSLETQQTETAPIVEYAGVGTAGNVGGTRDGGGLKWTANAALSWDYRHLTLGWTTRFFDSYFLNIRHSVDPNQGSATIPSQLYHDLFASYRFGTDGGTTLLSHTEVQLGINNIFNKASSIDVVGRGFSAPGYSYYGDPRGANWFLQFKANFGGNQ